jgi:DNA-binding response OmpR family regulator
VRILIIEDERRLAGNIARSMRESAGYAVDCAYDGEEGLYMAGANAYDLVVLDLMLPRLDGAAVLRGMRSAGTPAPVLVLTARDERESIIELLNAGADDYVTKPFDLGELMARAKALIRRGKGHSTPRLRVQDVEIDTAGQRVSRRGTAVALSAMEYRVLEYLAHRKGAVVQQRHRGVHFGAAAQAGRPQRRADPDLARAGIPAAGVACLASPSRAA